MRWAVSVLAVSAVLAASAEASAPTLNSLQRQVTALRQAVNAMQQSDVGAAATTAKNFDYAICFHAQDLDTINAVWHVLNVDLAYQGFQAQADLPRYDDGGACARVGMTRIR